MKLKLLYLFTTILIFSFAGQAQQNDTLRLSLVEAVNMAITQNPQLKSTQLNEEINVFKIKEVKSSALPQVTGNGTFTDNFSRASQLLPGEVFGGAPGTSIPVKFGTRYVMGGYGKSFAKNIRPFAAVGFKSCKRKPGLVRTANF